MASLAATPIAKHPFQVKRTARGFLDLAKASLSALLCLTIDPRMGAAFATHGGRSVKLAAMLVRVLAV
jgi:hypothetical protein